MLHLHAAQLHHFYPRLLKPLQAMTRWVFSEPGEQPALAAVREVLEETGIHAVVDGLAAVSSSPETVQYENGDRAQYLDLTFLCRAVGTDDPHVADNESTAVGWFEPNALPAPLMKSSHTRIAHAMAYRAHPENGTWFARP